MRGVSDEFISEWATRIPSLIAGAVGLIAIALWGRALGSPLGGLMAAAILAIHPNHIRYSSEARGYGLAMTFLILSSWMLCLALRGNSKWWHWVLFALFQALALYSFTASIYVLVLLNIAIVVLLGRRHFRDPGSGAVQCLKRWFVVNSVSACAYAVLALPTTMQTMRYLSTSKTFVWEMKPEHYQMLWARVFTGFDYTASHPENPLDTGLVVAPGATVLLMLLTVVFVFAVIFVARTGRWQSLLLLAPVAAAGAALAHGVAKGHAVFPQYFLPVFPAAVVVFGIFLAWAGERFVPKARWLPGCCLLSLFCAVLWNSTGILIAHPTENLRGAAEATRWQHESEPFADEEEAIVVSLWRSWEIYDPRLRFRVRTADELENVIAEARDEGKPLYVVVGHRALAEELNADILELLEDPERFEPLDTLWAPELFVTLWPYRLRPEAAP